MIEKYLHTLEYPKILDHLARYAMFSASKALVQTLKPSPYYSEALVLQAETTEARHLLSVKPDVGIGGARDVRPLLGQARRGMLLSTNELLTISRTIIAARELRRKITRLESNYPRLADIAYRLEDIPGLVNEISQCLDESGKVKNNASNKLAQIRREIDIAHGRLMDKMRRLVASEKYRQYLQEGFITQRDGRYVLPLKAEYKGRVKGIVHDQSTSGATIFVEPMAVVDINNKWKQLQIEEEQEVKRILAALTDMVGEHSKFIAATIVALANLDLIFAKARYAEAIEATAPQLEDWSDTTPQPIIHLKKARHPLLNPKTVVPIDLVPHSETTMVVITGPNTGGKTVSLKTIGLLTMMAQAGLHIPAEDGAKLNVFDNIFADIGDEQSLEQSLSTFSAHMTNIVTILENCTDHSLVIFDELGAGTDPIEGAALALSILNHLLKQTVNTLVATHYAELKAFAYTTPHVANASMAFNLETLSPTYKLQLGLPGNSNAFEIARRLGLSETILQQAQGLVGDEAKETEMMLAQIKADLDAAHIERLRLEEERAEAEYYRAKEEEKLATIDTERHKILTEAKEEASKLLEKTRIDLKRLKRQTKKAISKAVQQATEQQTEEPTQAEEPFKHIEKKLKTLEKTLNTPAPTPPPRLIKKRPLKIGAKVDIPHLQSKGVVTAINGNDVEVQLGHFRTTLKRHDLTPAALPEPEEEYPLERNTTISTSDSPGLELDLRGQISEQALDNLEKYLDRAYLSGLPFVRIIHGKGTGVLRQVVREALNGHPMITSYKPGTEKDGGDGVTTAKLAL